MRFRVRNVLTPSDMARVLRLASLVGLAAVAVACAASSADAGGNGASQAQVGTSSAALGFMCDCRAAGPGVENTNGIKECAYACTCDTFSQDGLRPAGAVTVGPFETEAFSFERWDKGSRICHGQYAYRATMDAPNWQIQVKFDRFKLSHLGYVVYEEPGDPSADPEMYSTQMVQSSSNVTEQIRRTAKAPEVTAALARKLGVTLAPPAPPTGEGR
jgi:hypothetical protein